MLEKVLSPMVSSGVWEGAGFASLFALPLGKLASLQELLQVTFLFLPLFLDTLQSTVLQPYFGVVLI